jgi:hypothetical protein
LPTRGVITPNPAHLCRDLILDCPILYVCRDGAACGFGRCVNRLATLWDHCLPSLLKLALFLLALTLVVPALVLAHSTSWRLAWLAWKQYAAWVGALYLLGFLSWLFMA